jgi:hypothetical protein
VESRRIPKETMKIKRKVSKKDTQPLTGPGQGPVWLDMPRNITAEGIQALVDQIRLVKDPNVTADGIRVLPGQDGLEPGGVRSGVRRAHGYAADKSGTSCTGGKP